MADQGRWFKLWVSAVNDPHLDNLDIADFGRWAKFGCYLKEQGRNGRIVVTPPSRSLCAKLQVQNFEELIAAIRRFPNCVVYPETDATVSHETDATVSQKYPQNDAENVQKSDVQKSEKMKRSDSFHETDATVSFIVEYQNWHKYQGDYSTHRVKKFRATKSKKRKSETVKEEKRREEKYIYTDHPPKKVSETQKKTSEYEEQRDYNRQQPLPVPNSENSTFPYKAKNAHNEQQPKSNGSAKEFIARYCELFKEKYGVNPVITARDAGIAKRMVKYPEYMKILELFFRSKDRFIRENKHTIGILESQVNKLLAEQSQWDEVWNE